MKLPGADRAIVDEAKVRDYLLSSEHPVGRFKAAFFANVGYTRQDWE
ncbi:MAG TPA: adhesin, partial [Thermoanaerobaculia bacterium]|nr:adhesin [Thermoanaerobaculia bacterium]